MRFSLQVRWGGLPFPPPVGHVLSELSSMTCLSWVALHSVVHSFIELCKPHHHDKAVVWKTQQWPQDWKRSITPIPKKGTTKECSSEVEVSVVSDSLWPHGLYSLWNFPGQNTGVGKLSLLQGIFTTQGLNPGLLHCRRILYQLSHRGRPRIHWWVAYPFSSRSSRARNQTWVSSIAGGFFTNWAIREARKNVLTIGQFYLSPMLERSRLKSYMLGFSIMWTKNFQMSKLGLKRRN